MTERRECPVCGVSVKLENLERHVANQHPRAGVAAETLLSTDERREVRRQKAVAHAPVVTRQGLIVVGAVAVVIAVVLGIVILNPFRGVGPGVGQTAPDFTFRTSTGGTITLSAYRANPTPAPVLLEFMDVDCPACQQEANDFVSLYNTYGSQVRFLSVDVNFVGAADTDARIESYKTQYGIAWHHGLDGGGIQQAYGVDSTPTTFILNGNGIVVAKFRGAQGSSDAYVPAIQQALGG